MGHPAGKRRATYADLEAVPRGTVAELIGGELYVFPRPAPRHANAAGQLIDPIARTLEVYALGAGHRWNEPTLHKEAASVRAVPFELKELDLSALWR
jgi:hypothetical protein